MTVSAGKINVTGLTTLFMMMMTETLASVLEIEIKLRCSCGMN